MSTISNVNMTGAGQLPGGSQSASSVSQKAETAQTKTLKTEDKDDAQYIRDMLEQAREKAQERRDSLKLSQNSAQYGDAAMTAYARLARARNQGQVNAAAGYAQRQIARCKAALRSDSENSDRIKAAIRQLEKAVSRAGKKKRELQREDLVRARQRRAARENQRRKAASLRQELERRKTMRMIRESGYLRETDIDNRQQAQIAATRMELRAQMQALSDSLKPSVDAVAREYAAQTGEIALAPAAEVDVQA